MRAPVLERLTGRGLPAAAVLVGLCLAHCLLYLSNDVDDAYINYRYSRSIARGDGPVFNPGQRVEGISSPAWVLMGVLPLWLGAEDPHRAMQAIGIASACATVALLFVLSQRLFAGQAAGWAWVAPLWLLARPGTGFWACSGMDATFYALLVTLAVWVWLRRGPGLRLGLCLGAAALTRPEAPWLFALLLALTPRSAWQGGALRRLLASLAGFAALFGPWLVFRVLYYGEILPNTYYAKQPEAALALSTGLEYLRGYLVSSAGIPLLAALLLLLRRRAPFPRLALLWLLSLLPILRLGADWMPQHRFLVHGMGIEALLVAGALHELAGLLRARSAGLAAALPVLLLVPWLGVEAARSARLVRAVERARPTLWARCRMLGQQIHGRRDVRSIALLDIGKIGYYADVPVIDLVGLTDPVIARAPGSHFHTTYDPRYVLDQHPDLIVLSTEGPGRMDRAHPVLDPASMTPVEARLYVHPAFQRGYVYDGAFSRAEPPGPRTGYYHLFLRRRAPGEP